MASLQIIEANFLEIPSVQKCFCDSLNTVRVFVLFRAKTSSKTLIVYFLFLQLL